MVKQQHQKSYSAICNISHIRPN